MLLSTKANRVETREDRARQGRGNCSAMKSLGKEHGLGQCTIRQSDIQETGLLMMPPSISETKESLDAFAQTLFRISEEPADLLHEAPHTTSISRPDEVRAARQPVMVSKSS